MTAPSAPVSRAKHPLSILAGPYGHPFHPVVVVVPIGAWVSAFVFDVLALTQPGAGVYVGAARLLILIGLAGAVVASILGTMDWAVIPRRTRAKAVATTHMVLNLTAMAAFAGSLALRLGVDDTVPVLALVLSIGGLALLAASGWLGGVIAHTYGVRVAEESTQREGLEPLP